MHGKKDLATAVALQDNDNLIYIDYSIFLILMMLILLFCPLLQLVRNQWEERNYVHNIDGDRKSSTGQRWAVDE